MVNPIKKMNKFHLLNVKQSKSHENIWCIYNKDKIIDFIDNKDIKFRFDN